MAVLAEHFVLGGQDALDRAHQGAALTGEVGIDLALEIGLEQVAGTHTDAQGERALEGAAGSVLVNSVRRIHAAALQEEAAQGGAGALRGHHDHIHVRGRDDAGALLVGDAEAMGEIQGLARGQVLLHGGPDRDLGRIGDQELDDGAFLAGLLDLEEVHARDPAVGDGLVIRLALALADDDVEAVVFQVQGLSGALDAVADDGDGFVLQDFACVFQGEFLAGHDVLVDTAKIDLCHVYLLFNC